MVTLDPIASDTQTNGVFPQVSSMGEGYRWKDPDSLTQIRSNEPLATPPNLRSFHLDPRTNATDLISQGYINAIGLLASTRFVDALGGFAIQAHERHPAEVVLHGTPLSYWWLHMIDSLEERIDYSRSEFFAVDRNGHEGVLDVASHEDLRRQARESVERLSGDVLPRRITFLHGTRQLDLLALRMTSPLFYVSEKLAETLQKQSLTGFTLQPSTVSFTFG